MIWKRKTLNGIKEERYDIGLDEVNNKNIQFKTFEQVIICDKVQLPCVIKHAELLQSL